MDLLVKKNFAAAGVSMEMPKPLVEPIGLRAERTRAAILSVGEELFSSRGFASTRLSDVADAVGVTRAGLLYHFADKQALFDAVLSDAFGSLAERLRRTISGSAMSITERIEASIEAWIDAVMDRPALAKLILRIVTDGPQELAHGLFSDDDQLAVEYWNLFFEGVQSGELKPQSENPLHAASVVIGATVFYKTAMATLLSEGRFQPPSSVQIADYKRDVLGVAAYVLGFQKSERPS